MAAVAGEVNAALAADGCIVVTAPPGSGKSTLLPLTILEGIPEGKILMLEPRRAAARQIAMRMARMLGEKPGETVGYRMRFESKVSKMTRVEVVTEGVMERMLIDDPTLDGVAAVIFDEFHERSLTADISLALTLEARNLIRPDLKIVVMSATMDTGTLCPAVGARLIEATGKMYDVRIIHLEDYDIADCVPAVVSAVRRAFREQEGNILAFLPGQAEISKCAEALGNLPEADVLPLYGNLPAEEQYRVLDYNPAGRRKIVLATPIAETSLTIEGVRAVVDSGLHRTVRFNAATGLGHLETERISLDMARQRTGRAGRLSEGVCYRLWSKAAEHRMPENRTPEILDADLCSMTLDIAAWGGDPLSLPWLTPPPPSHVAEARQLLTLLGAFDEKGDITPRGRRMAALPCHPRIANMLLSASENRLGTLAADIAAILEEKDPVSDDNNADLNTRLLLLREQRRRNPSGIWGRIEHVAAQYRRMVRCDVDNSPVDAYDTGMLLASAYPGRVAMRLKDGVYRLPGGENVRLNEADDLSANEFLVVAAMGKRIFLASPVSRETLIGIAQSHENVSWNSREGRLVARNELRIGVLPIDTRPIDNPDPELVAKTISTAAVKEGRSMLDFNDDVARLQRRVATVAEWHPEFGLPDVSTDTLLASAPEWLPMYIGKAVSVQQLRKIDLREVIGGIVGYELMAQIDRIAPTHLRLPGGRKVHIDYRAGSEAPVVSARIGDCFGMHDTPRLDEGRRPVLMELLSPGFKPVQLTQDMSGFWTGTYFDVRKELRRRYPKHPWPDNPLDYKPTDRLK